MTTEFSVREHEQLGTVAAVSGTSENIYYAIPNNQTLERVKTLHSKEPETMAWISGFAASDVFVDIGANVGMYTIWAAVTRGVSVYAFEPESQNYALLNVNIFLNQLGSQVHAYCIAMSDGIAFSELHLSSFMAGESCHTFDEKVDFHLQPFQPQFSQGCFSTTVDSLIDQRVVPIPQHIKIDVDGIEHRVLAGCAKALEKAELRSVLIELNTHLPQHREIVDRMRGLGFGLSEEQVRSAVRTGGTFDGVGNYIFRRDLA